MCVPRHCTGNRIDPSDSAATPGEHDLENAIDDFLESGNKADNYRDTLKRYTDPELPSKNK